MKTKKITNGFRNLGVMLRPYWKNGKLYCVLYTLDSIIGNVWYTMMYVYLMQIVLDQLARGGRFPVLAATVLAFGLLNVLWNIANAFLFKLYFDPKQDMILENIDREVQEHMHRTDYRYFDNPEFYDAYAVAYGSYAQKASDTFWTCSNVLAQVMTISALVAYVLSSTGYIVAIALLSVVARVLISKVVSRILNSIIFAEDNRATTVLISHRLTNVVNADYIYVMKDGRIAEEGTHASLMEQQGYYHEMFTLQAKNYIAASTGGYATC